MWSWASCLAVRKPWEVIRWGFLQISKPISSKYSFKALFRNVFCSVVLVSGRLSRLYRSKKSIWAINCSVIARPMSGRVTARAPLRGRGQSSAACRNHVYTYTLSSHVDIVCHITSHARCWSLQSSSLPAVITVLHPSHSKLSCLVVNALTTDPLKDLQSATVY